MQQKWFKYFKIMKLPTESVFSGVDEPSIHGKCSKQNSAAVQKRVKMELHLKNYWFSELSLRITHMNFST